MHDVRQPHGAEVLDLPVGHPAVDLEPAQRAARRQSAAYRERLHHRHVRLQAEGAGVLHLAVDVELRRAFHVDYVAVLETEVVGHIAASIHRRNVHRRPARLTVAVEHHDDVVVSRGSDAARQSQHVDQVVADIVQRVASRPPHLPQHRHLTAAYLQYRQIHLRPHHELPARELLGDARFGIRGREAADDHLADQREVDRAALGDPSLGGEVGVLEHANANHVTFAENVVRHSVGNLRRTHGRKRISATNNNSLR